MFKGWYWKDLVFYYINNIDHCIFPTFFHWLTFLKDAGEY